MKRIHGWLLPLFLLLAGCGGGGAGGDATPIVNDSAVAPSELRFTGGAVTISAMVTDDLGLSRVWAVITRPDQTTASVDMAGNGQLFSGTWTAPPNPRTDGVDALYRVIIHARDTGGQVAETTEQQFRVEATETPPPNPF